MTDISSARDILNSNSQQIDFKENLEFKHYFPLRGILKETLEQAVSLSYFVTAVACQVLGFSDLASQCYQLSRYHWRASLLELRTLDVFDPLPVIQYAHNSVALPVPEHRNLASEEESLKKVYGQALDKMVIQAKASGIKVDPARMRRLPMNRALSVGSSLDFGRRYLKRRRKGASALHCVQQVGALFRRNAPQKAEIAQVIFESLDSSEVWRKRADIQQTLRGELLQRKAKYQCALDNIQKEGKAFEAQPEHIRQKGEQTLVDAYQGLITGFKADAQRLADQWARAEADALWEGFHVAACSQNLVLSKPVVWADWGRPYYEELPEELPTFTSQLNPGVYVVELGGAAPNTDYHTITLIKESDDLIFIFDPNFGTAVAYDLSDCAKQLWRLAAHLYLHRTETPSCLAFYRCELRHTVGEG